MIRDSLTPSVQIILPNWLQLYCGKRPSPTSVTGWREREPQILSWGICVPPHPEQHRKFVHASATDNVLERERGSWCLPAPLFLIGLTSSSRMNYDIAYQYH